MKKLSLLLSVALLLVVGPSHSHGSILVTAVESGGNVVFSGGGTADIHGLTQGSTRTTIAGVNAINPSLNMAAADVEFYSSISGPTNIGPGTGGGFSQADSFLGDNFGINVSGGTLLLLLPVEYVSGSSLTGMMSFLGESFASLGLTPGTYVWTWENILPNSILPVVTTDSFTLQIGAVPEPTTVIIWSMFAGVGLVAARRRRLV